jgi:thioredoxin 1
MYFSADWCGPCKTFKPTVLQVSQDLKIPIDFVNVDYDASLSQKYSISSIPTIIVADETGTEVFRNSGVMPREQLISVLSKYK